MKTIKIPYYLHKLYGRKTTHVSDVNYEHVKADAENDKISLGEAWHQRYGRIELQKVEITKRQGEINVMVEEHKEPKKEQTPTQSESAKTVVAKQKKGGWHYSKELQGLVRFKHAPTHDEHGVLLPHLQRQKEER